MIVADNIKSYFPKINLNDFDYNLPPWLIAEHPLEVRSQSRLMVVHRKKSIIEHRTFVELQEILEPGSMLVVNDSKVIAARLNFFKESGGSVEVFCLSPIEPSSNPQIALQAKNSCIWNCLVGGKRVYEGMILSAYIEKFDTILYAKVLEKKYSNAVIQFYWHHDSIEFGDILGSSGVVPLPPYIHRAATEKDKTTYQTVYAQHEGSVAAPTAGLHFSQEILDSIEQRNIKIEKLTLHVGAGTFQPVKNDDVTHHDMHSERFVIAADTVESLLKHLQSRPKRQITAVGTTSARSLETLYWLGFKSISNILQNDLTLNQYEPYYFSSQSKKMLKVATALESLLEWLSKRNLKQTFADTSLFIVPGYKFRMINSLVTNFHIPKSTLVLLVAAYLGKDLWQKSYEEAIAHNYRFLSYGDCTFLTD